MNELVNKTILDINEKLGWANNSFDKLVINKKDVNEVQYNFWSFLTAFQQSWFYYNKLIKELNPTLQGEKLKALSLKIINDWKENDLDEKERISWDVLQTLRNHDTHFDPVKANYEIKFVSLADCNGYLLKDRDGAYLLVKSEELIIQFNEKEYDLENLVTNGIKCVNKLIDYLPNI